MVRCRMSLIGTLKESGSLVYFAGELLYEHEFFFIINCNGQKALILNDGSFSCFGVNTIISGKIIKIVCQSGMLVIHSNIKRLFKLSFCRKIEGNKEKYVGADDELKNIKHPYYDLVQINRNPCHITNCICHWKLYRVPNADNIITSFGAILRPILMLLKVAFIDDIALSIFWLTIDCARYDITNYVIPHGF